jgi:hypothetical protein
MRTSISWLLLVAVLMAGAGMAQADEAVASRVNALKSRLLSMGHGFYSQAEWDDILGQLSALATRAEAGRDATSLIEIRLLQALVHGDVRKEYEAARSILEEVKSRYGQQDLSVVRRVYGELAETYSRLGDQAALDKLIEEFKQSPAFDAEPYAVSGGWGPADPVTLVRPGAGTTGSTTLTAMESKKSLARLATGRPFPDFQVRDRSGATISLADFRGKPVLIDFWVRKWHPWEQRLPYLIDVYNRYREQGFEVLGICLDKDTEGVDRYLADKGVPWRQVVGDDELARGLGLFGTATSFLLDGQGAILGRDLTEANLVQAIKDALEE